MVLLTLPTFAVHAEGVIEPQIGTETPAEVSLPVIEENAPEASLAPVDPDLTPDGEDLGTDNEEPQNLDVEIPAAPEGVDPILAPAPETNPDAVLNEEPAQTVNSDDVLGAGTETEILPVLGTSGEAALSDAAVTDLEKAVEPVEPGDQSVLVPDPQFCSSGTPNGGTCAPQRGTFAEHR